MSMKSEYVLTCSQCDWVRTCEFNVAAQAHASAHLQVHDKATVTCVEHRTTDLYCFKMDGGKDSV